MINAPKANGNQGSAPAIRRSVYLALFTCLAAGLYLVENLIPKPLPFLRLGLANAVVLWLMAQGKIGVSVLVALAKVLVGGFLGGVLFSPATPIALASTGAAWLAMLIALGLPVRLSLIGASVAGAVGHGLTQLVVVRFLIIPDNGVFDFAPLLIALGVLTGVFTGYLAVALNSNIQLNRV